MFLDLTGVADPLLLAHRIRDLVRQIAKIPTCVGIGPTKTIAKLANKAAKSYRSGTGVCDLSTEDARAAAYPGIDISDVWGLGPASAAKLARRGVTNVAAFVALPQDEVRELLTVVGARTHAELKGVNCIPFSQTPPTRKSLAVTAAQQEKALLRFAIVLTTLVVNHLYREKYVDL